MIREKIKTKEQIGEIVKELRKNDPKVKIVTTNGSFDLIHVGHLYSLEQAKAFGTVLIVGLNSDSSIKEYKSPDRPIIPQQERAGLLSGFEVVDYIVIFDETDPRELLKAIKPDIHVKSKSGFVAEPGFIDGIEREVVEENGGKVELIEDLRGISTSEIVKKIISLKV
jgi:rfaE bifunctional protein nucleotidyltransferase chain/domain